MIGASPRVPVRARAQCMLRHQPSFETFSGAAFHEHRLSVKRQPELLTQAYQLCVVGSVIRIRCQRWLARTSVA